MKGKKLISLLCAAAMTTSAFASMAVTASAAETVLWSDTFDGYENSVTHQTNPDAVGSVLLDGTSTARSQYEGIDGITLYTANRADDSSYFQLTEDNGVGKALTTNVSRFANNKRGASVVFKEEYRPTSTSDLVLAFKVKAVNEKGTTFDTAMVLNDDNSQEINFESLGVTLGEWTRIKLVITSAGTSIYIGDSTTAAETLTANTLSSINFNGLVNGVDDTSSSGAQKSPSHPFGYPAISLDDVVVYTTDAGNGLASTVPPAETHGEAEVTYETVPVATAPEGFGLVAKDDFNSATPDRLIYIETDAESVYSNFKTVTLRIGPAADAQGTTKWEIIGNPKTDPELGEKYLKAFSGPRSTANRGPKMEFKYGEIAERENVVAYFATRLHKNNDKPAEVIFSSDLVASESKGDIASPLAMITTDDAAESGVYACANPLTKVADGGTNVLEVSDNTWVLVKIDAYRSEGKTAGAKISVTIDGEEHYIFGSADAYADMKDNLKKGINTLPFVSFRSGNDTTYGVSNTTNDIDNIAVYSSNIEPVEFHSVKVEQDTTNLQKITVTSTDEGDESFDGVLIHAAYNTANQLVGIKTYDLTESKTITKAGTEIEIPAEDTVHTGDKIMVWNSVDGMLPYGLLTVEAGAAQPTLEPTEAPTATPTLEPTATPTLEPTATPTLEPTATPTQEPVADPTATPTTGPVVPTTYAITSAPATNGSFVINGANNGSAAAGAMITVVPNADSGYELDTITVTPTNTESETTVPVSAVGTFTMPAEAVTVTVTFKAETVVPTTYTVTLAAGEGGSFAEGAKTSFTVNENGTLASETITEPTKEGYTFAGWVKGTDVAITTEALKAVQITGDVTYTATYTENGPAEGIYEYSYQANGVTIPLFVLVK